MAAAVDSNPPLDGEEAAAAADEEAAATAFTPSLRSDVAPAQALQLLHEVALKDAAYAHFSTHELQALIGVLSILKVPAGETVIVRGETATFCGIVLQGCLLAQVSPVLAVELRQGALVGEMALFEGSQRNADIRASPNHGDAVLGTITYAELHELSVVHPALARALWVLFASASMRKLRKMNMNSEQLAELARRDEEKLAEATRLRAKENGAAAPASSAAAAAASEPALTSEKRELLYRLRMEQDAAAAAAAAAATAAASKSSPDKKNAGGGKAGSRSAAAAVADKTSRGTDKVRLENATRKLAAVTSSLEERDKEVEEARAEMRKLLRSQTGLEKARDEALAACAKLSAQMAEQSQISSANEARLQAALAAAQRESEARWEPALAALKAELARAKADSETAGAHSRRTGEEQLKLLEANRAMADSLSSLTDIRNQLFSELFEARKRVGALEREVSERDRSLNSLTVSSRALEGRLLESEEKLSAALPWKTKALEAQQSLVSAQKLAEAQVEAALEGKVELEFDIGRLKKLLKLVVIGTYVRESRLKKSMAKLHQITSDMLINALEQNINAGAAGGGGTTATTNGGKATPVGGDLAAADPLLMQQQYLSHPSFTSASSSFSTSSSSGPSLKSIAKRKKAYISALLHSRVRPREILASLTEEVSKLRAPLEQSLESVAHWKSTSAAFFERTIELTAARDELQQALEVTNQKIQMARNMMNHNNNNSGKQNLNNQHQNGEQQQQQELQLKNQELQRTNTALRSEIDRLMSSPAAASTSDLATAATAAGVSLGGGKKSAVSEQQIQALQRQQQMLQANIHMLQTHYASLLSTVQQQGAGRSPQQQRSLQRGGSSTASLHHQQQQHQQDEKQEYRDLDSWAAAAAATSTTSPRAGRSQAPSAHSSRTNLHQRSPSASSQSQQQQQQHPQLTPYPPREPQNSPLSTAGQIPLRSAQIAASPLRPLQHTFHPVIPAALQQQQSHSHTAQQEQQLQRERYNQAVAAGAGGGQTPRKAASAAVDQQQQHFAASPRSSSGYHLPSMQATGSPRSLDAGTVLLPYKAAVKQPAARTAR